MKKLIPVILVFVGGCTVPYPPMPPAPPSPPKVMEFKVEGKNITIQGTLKSGTSLMANEARDQLSVAAELLDK